MRIVVGSLQHETNTFSPVKTICSDFDIIRGNEMLKKIAVTDLLRKEGVEIITTLYANAVPSGRLDKNSYIKMSEELLGRIPEKEKIDGIWLYLHGAMEVEDIGSGELLLLKRIRNKVGYDIPISIALDFHANNSEKIIDLANIIYGYRTAPHTDMKETQIRSAQLLLECIKKRIIPRTVIMKLPLMITGDKVITEAEPMKSIMDELVEFEKTEGILCASVFNGQPWVDAPNTGASITASITGNEHNIYNKMKHLAKKYWDLRKEFHFQVEALEPERAIYAALDSSEDLVFLTDSGDNTTAGAPGDSAYMLDILIKSKAKNTIVAGITDSRVVEKCRNLSIGDSVNVEIGGEYDNKAKKVRINGTIKNKGEVLGWDGEISGKAVIISIYGIDIIVTEKRCAFISPEIFNSIDININDYKIVVVKQGYLFPKLAKISKRTILALTPGASCEQIENLYFKNISRPVYPIDTNFKLDLKVFG